MLTVPGKDRILGVTIVGEHAADLLAEANKYAAGEWRRAHTPQRALAWPERFHRWNRA